MINEHRILVVDDEINLLKAMRRKLNKLYHIDMANSAAEAIALMKNSKTVYAVVISDMNMPEVNGLELLKNIREISPETIRIMLTGNADQETAINAVNQGAVFRFLTKPCSSELMIECIEAALECFCERQINDEKANNMLEHVKELSSELKKSRHFDSVTALPNLMYFDEFHKNIFKEASQQGLEQCLCFIDMDQFRIVKDVCGMEAGNALLKLIAETIHNCLDRKHLLARVGDDEFAILLLDADITYAKGLMNDIKDEIGNLQFVWDSKKYSVSISVGIASSKDTSNADGLFKLASSSCSYAKLKGRDCICTYSEDDAGISQHNKELEWVNRINEALDEDRFTLFFQTIAPTKANDSRHHYEILVRMLDENNKLVMPGDFLPTVEKYNFARRLDRWVITHTLCWLNEHPEHVDNLDLCSINLSGNTLTDPGLTEFIIHCFKKYAIPPEKVSFEITETAAISNFEVAKSFISNIKKLGCRFALDDFGSGLSSFAYLKKIEADYLKIDGQFIKDIIDNPIDLEIVKSITGIGHAMDMQIIGEFVENEKIFALLKKLGVDYAQGYGVAKPMPLEQFHECDTPAISASCG